MASNTIYEDMTSEDSSRFDYCSNDNMHEIDELMKSSDFDKAFADYFGAQIDRRAQDALAGTEKEAAPKAHCSLTTGLEMLPEEIESLYEDSPPMAQSKELTAAVIERNSAVAFNQDPIEDQELLNAVSAFIGQKTKNPVDVAAKPESAFHIPRTSWNIGSTALVPSAAGEQKFQDLGDDTFGNSLDEDNSPSYPIRKKGNFRSQTSWKSTKKTDSNNTPTPSPAERRQLVPAGAASPQLDKQQCLDLLTASFKNLASCKGTAREIAFVKKTTDSDIDKWCRELYDYSLQRVHNKSSTLPPRTKRGGCHNSPEYSTNSDRIQAIASVLHCDKRACFRFNGDDSWSHKLADDPMWQRDAICINDKGNSDKSRRAQQSKDNATTIVQDLQDLKQVLLGGPSDVTVEMLLEKFDHIEKLAIYIQDPPKAEQAAGNLLGRVRGKRAKDMSEESAADEIESPDTDAVLSLYATQATPPSINQQMRNTHLGGSSPKKRKLTNGHGVPGTPTPLRNAYLASFQSSPQIAPPAFSYANASVELQTRSALPHTVSAEVEGTFAQPDPHLTAKPALLDPHVIYSIEEIRKWHVLQRAYSLQCLDRIQQQEHGEFLQAQHQIPTKEDRHRHAQKFFDDRQEQRIRRIDELDRKLSEHTVRCLENQKRLQQALAVEGVLDPTLTD